MPRTVTLTDEDGNDLGQADLVEAHSGEGKLHRAFSVYVFTPDRKSILIQRRSRKKMLWPLVWANTTCSHPYEKENPVDAGRRRLKEEMGVDCVLVPRGSFVYRAEDPEGRGIEHEHVTLLLGILPKKEPSPDPAEVADWKWMDIDELRKDMAVRREEFAPWFHLGLDELAPVGSPEESV